MTASSGLSRGTLSHSQFGQLLPAYLQARDADTPLVLATLIHTEGSSYRKAGAQMLLTATGLQLGLLSGGCLESDLQNHAQQLLQQGHARRVRYDMRQDDDVFGLGAGCMGALDIFLMRCGPENHWQPLATLHDRWQQRRPGSQPCSLGLVVSAWHSGLPTGSVLLDDHSAITPTGAHCQHRLELSALPANRVIAHEGGELFVLTLRPPPQVLLLGAGVDARPLAQLIDFMGWHGTVYDHRPAYATATYFPTSTQVLCAPVTDLATQITLDTFDAAIIMSHHLVSDLRYLEALAPSRLAYLGLLGPPARTERLLAQLPPPVAGSLRARLHAPVGMNIGASTPEAIALAIIAEIHHCLANPA